MRQRYKQFFETPEQLNTPEFKKWFGHSKVVDRSGKPLVVYHGSRNKFNTFKKNGYSHDKSIDKSIDKYGSGFYFFNDESDAELYGNVIYKCYLKINNPFIVKDLYPKEFYATKKNIEFPVDFNSYKGKPENYYSKFNSITGEETTKFLISLGYDGIIHDYTDTFVVFYPNQIKSTTDNNGKFNVSSNNIYEDISIPLNINDTFKYGKFKNKTGIVKSFGKNEKGEDIIITDDGKEIQLLKIRLIKERYKKFFESTIPFIDFIKRKYLYDINIKNSDKDMGLNVYFSIDDVIIQTWIREESDIILLMTIATKEGKDLIKTAYGTGQGLKLIYFFKEYADKTKKKFIVPDAVNSALSFWNKIKWLKRDNSVFIKFEGELYNPTNTFSYEP
jgi:hypothetical protein